MYRIAWTRKAQKQLLKIAHLDQTIILQAVDTLANFPACKDVKALTGHECGYRLRAGRYRVLFDSQTEVRIISIMEVKKRDERTY